LTFTFINFDVMRY